MQRFGFTWARQAKYVAMFVRLPVAAFIGVAGLTMAPSTQGQTQTRTLYESAPLTVRGTVQAGPCDSALLLRADDGKLYELDRKRVRVVAGQRIVAKGSVYPRVSVCQRYPWVDLTTVDSQAALPEGVSPVISSLPSKPNVMPAEWTLIIVGSIDTLRATLEEAQTLRKRIPLELAVAVGVSATSKTLLPALGAAIGDSFERLNGVQVTQIDAEAASKYLLRGNDQDEAFSTIDVLVAEWRKRVAPKS